MNNNIDQINPQNEQEHDNKRTNNIIIILIIFAVVLLIVLVVSRVLTASNNDSPTSPEDSINSTTDNNNPPMVEDSEYKTQEEALDSVKGIINTQKNADNYDIVFKEETKDVWIFEKVNKTNGKAEEEYLVGKNSGIINTNDLNKTTSSSNKNIVEGKE